MIRATVWLQAILLFSSTLIAEERHGLLTEILSRHVRDGLVDYRGLRSNPKLGEYCAWLASNNPESSPSAPDQLAFWINAYNAYTLKVIADNYPVKSINDLHSGGRTLGTIFKTTIWDKKLARIGGKELSLNHIEHNVIRPRFQDPRAHFALVCASRSCPQLRPEAYEGARLEHQLDHQARVFLSDPFRNVFDLEAKTAHLSKIFDWYGRDFGRNDEALLRFLARFLPKTVSEALLAQPRSWKIRFKDYDWGLNESPAPGRTGPSPRVEKPLGE